MNKILLIIVVLIVLLGAFAFFGNKKTDQEVVPSVMAPDKEALPSQMQEENKPATVILSDGFTPKDITVKVGTTVVWVNKSGKSATVSSDDHPTHKLHTFLNLGEFPSSSTLQVIFDTPGKYSYHNHLNASEIGTVTVE